MTKKCNVSVYIFLLILVSFLSVSLYGADTSPASTDWTIGAEKFTLTRKRMETTATSAAAELLPKLILEQLAENLERIPSAREQFDQKQYDMQKKRLDLFLQLSKEVQTRDSLVLGDYSKKELDAAIKLEDEKIDGIRKQIRDNLAEEAEAEKDSAGDIEREKERESVIDEGKVVDEDSLSDREKDDAARFKEMIKQFVPGTSQAAVNRQVKLYKNDFTQLFDAGKDISAEGYESRDFEDAVIAAGINALLTGRLTIYGEYISATVSIIVYPGVKIVGTVTDVSNISDMRALAVSIARQLTPKITNSMPVELAFDIKPAQAASAIVLTVDDVVYKRLPDHLIVESGIHSIMLSSPGFRQVSTSYAFRGSRKFNISVEMQPDNQGKILIRLKKPLIGTMYGNGAKAGAVDEEYPAVEMKINNQPVLGQFIAGNGESAFFYVPVNLIQNDATLMVNAKPFDRSKYIDVRRRWMYGSYSALIISLMGTFYSYGTFYADSIAYTNGYVDYDTAAGWQKAYQICAGISIGCGVFFVYELIRYFIAADKVLPSRAYDSNYDAELLPKIQESIQEPSDSPSGERPSGGIGGAAEKEAGGEKSDNGVQ
jgi:hypothetical protein